MAELSASEFRALVKRLDRWGNALDHETHRDEVVMLADASDAFESAARQAEQIARVIAAAPCEEWLAAEGLMLRECRILRGWHTMETHAYKQPAWLRAVLVAESAPEAVAENG